MRRPEILATTVELVREHGLSNVRVIDVAGRAGTSPASVISHFASKDQLFGQAVTKSLEAAAIELGCRESDLQEAAARVPVAIQSSNAGGAQ